MLKNELEIFMKFGFSFKINSFLSGKSSTYEVGQIEVNLTWFKVIYVSALYYLDCSWNVTCAHTKVYRFTAVWKWRSQKEIKFSSEQFHHQASEAMFPI